MKFEIPENIKKFLTKDKLILIFLFGILLIVINLPVKSSFLKKNDSQSEETKTTDVVQYDVDSYKNGLEKDLEDVLSETEGVGRVRVFITLKSSARNNLFTQKEKTESQVTENNSSANQQSAREYTEKESIVYTDNGKTPFVVNYDMPEIQGALIIAEGGDDISTVARITNAASALLGITVNRIKVFKMEG